jgi:hypothetical protein
MNGMIEFFLSILWIILFVGMLIGVFVNAKFVSKYIHQLKSLRPEQWAQIQSLDVMSGEMKTQINFLKFLFQKKYETLGDFEIANSGESLRTFFIGYFIVCAIFFLITAILLIS